MTSPGPHTSGCPRNTEGATGLEVGGARGAVGDEGGATGPISPVKCLGFSLESEELGSR